MTLQSGPGVHCAPLIHRALGTEKQGTIRFSFSWFNTEEEALQAAWAVKETGILGRQVGFYETVIFHIDVNSAFFILGRLCTV